MSRSEDIKYRARVFLDKTIKAEVQKEIEKLAYAVLGNKTLKVEHRKEGFDKYPYCKHDTKNYCPVGNKNYQYMGKWDQWIVYGQTRTDVYLEVLRMLANDSSTYFPIVSFRPDSEWVDRDKVEKYKEE